jgi:hypothetical protein
MICFQSVGHQLPSSIFLILQGPYAFGFAAKTVIVTILDSSSSMPVMTSAIVPSATFCVARHPEMPVPAAGGRIIDYGASREPLKECFGLFGWLSVPPSSTRHNTL